MSTSAKQKAAALLSDVGKEGTGDSLNRCLVYCRLRPTKAEELTDGAFELLTLRPKQVCVHEEKTYDFDGTFGGNSEQQSIFETVGKPCVDHALEGFRSALMCYGQTGTGKSFTMCNLRAGQEGIIPRAASYLFERIEDSPDRKYQVTVQLLQIYRDNLGDLMSESGKDRVDIYFEKDDGVTLPGCSSHTVNGKDEFMRVWEEGNSRRVTTATAMNPESSRGHTALLVWITSEPTGDDCGAVRHGKITFVDLAGYERFSKTGISNASPIMKDEAKTINASLLSLGHVVSSLSNRDKHVPWRNSKLTRLLQDSIGGRSRTTIVLTVGPSSEHLHETANTLQLGQRAMAVKVSAQVTENIDYVKLATKLQGMLNEKDERINALQLELATHEAEQEQLKALHDRDMRQLKQRHEEELSRLKTDGAAEEQLETLLKRQELETENMLVQQKEELEYAVEGHERDTLKIVEEQTHKSELKWADEKIALKDEIERLQEKLQQQPEDQIEQLKKALAQKDELLASRAADIEALNAAMESKEAGNESNSDDDLLMATTRAAVVDAAIVEELKEKHSEELQKKHRQLLEMQIETDRLQELCRDRAADLAEARDKINDLNTVVARLDPDLASTQADLKIEQVQMIEAKELDLLKKRMDQQLEVKDSVIERLRQQLYPGAGPAAEEQQATPRMARSRSGIAQSGIPEVARFQIEALKKQLDSQKRLTAEKEAAIERLTEERTAVEGGTDGSVATSTQKLLELRSEEILALRQKLDEAHEAIQKRFNSECAEAEYPDWQPEAVRVGFSIMSQLLRNERERNLKIIEAFENVESQQESLSVIHAEYEAELSLKDDTIVDLSAKIFQLEAEKPLAVTDDKCVGAALESPAAPPAEAAPAPEPDSESDDLVLDANPWRERLVDVENSLRTAVDKLNKCQLENALLRKERTGDEQEFSGPEGLLVDNSDIHIVIDCKEAELRIVHYRLEQRELALQRSNERTHHLESYVADLREQLETHDLSPLPAPTILSSDVADLDAGTASSSRHQLEGLLQLLKSVRKQNSVLHGLILERSAVLRRYTWMLLDRGIISHTDERELKTLMSGSSEDLRLAFAERDEEIFTKDQALINRSTEVVVLEEALSALYDQLTESGATPCRPLTKFSMYTTSARQEAQHELIRREKSRASLLEKRLEIQEELEAVEKVLQACQEQLVDETKPVEAPVLLEEIGNLRTKLDLLKDKRQIIDAQCAAHDQELEMLHKVLAQSTKAMLEMHAQKDLDVGMTVMERFKNKFLKK